MGNVNDQRRESYVDDGMGWFAQKMDPVGWVGIPSDSVVSATSHWQTPDPGSSSEYSRGDHTHGTPPIPVSSQIAFLPTGWVSSWNVQSAIEEIDSEKAALSGASFIGDISAPNLSNTNTGDETATTIVTKIGDGSKISSAYLPSYVDDVVEAADFASLPVTGETGKIYVTVDTGYQYRWSGSVYVEIKDSGETVASFGVLVNGAPAATPNDTDFIATAESGGILKKISWTNAKAFMKTYFDTLYASVSSLSSYVPTSRSLTINGTTYDLSADRTWTVSGGGGEWTANHETITSTGQTVFNLGFSYVVGDNGLTVYVNGLLQTKGTDYTETGTSQVTFLSTVTSGNVVDFQHSAGVGATWPQWPAGWPVNSVKWTAVLNFDTEDNKAVVTVSSALITSANLIGALFVPQETSETSLDDFVNNGVTVCVANIVDNTSFDIIGSASNNATWNYTVSYSLNY